MKAQVSSPSNLTCYPQAASFTSEAAIGHSLKSGITGSYRTVRKHIDQGIGRVGVGSQSSCCGAANAQRRVVEQGPQSIDAVNPPDQAPRRGGPHQPIRVR